MAKTWALLGIAMLLILQYTVLFLALKEVVSVVNKMQYHILPVEDNR